MKMLAVILASLAKLVVILKLGLRNISQKDNKSHDFVVRFRLSPINHVAVECISPPQHD